MPAVGKDECRLVPENSRSPENRLPRRDMVREAGDDISFDPAPQAAHVDGFPVQGQGGCAGPGSWHIGRTPPAAMLAFFSSSRATNLSFAVASGSSRIRAS